MAADLSRRNLLAGTAALLGATAIGAGRWYGGSSSGESDKDVPAGTAYVAERSLSEDPSIRQDARALEHILDPTRNDDFAEALDAAVVSDMDNGDIIEIDGWQLARSEAAFAVISAGMA